VRRNLQPATPGDLLDHPRHPDRIGRSVRAFILAAVSSRRDLFAPPALFSYAAVVVALSLPAVLSRGLLWEWSLAIMVIVAIPTAAFGVLMLLPVLRRIIAVLALGWVVFLTLSWATTGPLFMVLLSGAAAIAVGMSLVERFREPRAAKG
jgi:hypothetical protein